MRRFFRIAPSSATEVGRSRGLRREATDAERKLWAALRGRQLQGCKFRRQAPIENFIVDFVCPERRLIVELDGGQHIERKSYDDQRSRALAQRGYRVIRFWNNEVLRSIEGVLSEIVRTLGED